MSRLLLLIGLVLNVSGQSVLAAGQYGPGQYKVDYRSYNQALETGNIAAAIEYGRTAWRAAEGELGDNDLTAILAYNYSNLIYVSDPQAAIEPLERVIALTGEADEKFGSETPALMLAVAKFEASNKKRKARWVLEKVLRETPQKSLIGARVWFDLAKIYLAKTDYGATKRTIDNARMEYLAVAPDLKDNLVDTYIISAIARIAGKSRSEGDIRNAYKFLYSAIELFPPQKDIEQFAPTLALAVAWVEATSVAEISDRDFKRHNESTTRAKRKTIEHNGGVDRIKWSEKRSSNEECNISFGDSIGALKFPIEELQRGSLSAILISYNIAEDGETLSPKILSEVPSQSVFGEIALQVIQDAKIEKGFINEPRCTDNRIMVFKFTIH